MPYEDPIEANLRALTGVVWVKRKNILEARTNKAHARNLGLLLADHHIVHVSEESAAQSGRYVTSVPLSEVAKIEQAVATTGAAVKPHRRKWQS